MGWGLGERSLSGFLHLTRNGEVLGRLRADGFLKSLFASGRIDGRDEAE